MSFSANQCGYCGDSMRISQLSCSECGLSHGGEFHTPRLYRLAREEQQFSELFILASGSLKEMARILGVSYPTVRSRLDRLIDKLTLEQQRDEQQKNKILADIETGKINAKQGMRLIEAI